MIVAFAQKRDIGSKCKPCEKKKCTPFFNFKLCACSQRQSLPCTFKLCDMWFTAYKRVTVPISGRIVLKCYVTHPSDSAIVFRIGALNRKFHSWPRQCFFFFLMAGKQKQNKQGNPQLFLISVHFRDCWWYSSTMARQGSVVAISSCIFALTDT